MKVSVRASVLLFLALSLTSGCQQKTDEAADVTVDLRVEPSPPKVGKAQLTLDVRDDGKPVEGATLKLEGNMAHAGMKPVFADAKEDKEKPGRYRAELDFTMGGDWFVLVTGKLADGRTLNKKIDVKRVKAN
jgi:hypothetical protein